MEYYLYRNGAAYLCLTMTDDSHLTLAQMHLRGLRSMGSANVWFMEDEDGVEVVV